MRELGGGKIAATERATRCRKGFEPAELAAQQARPRPVEQAAGRKACAQHRLDGERSPASAVELDLDATGACGPKSGDRGHSGPCFPDA